MICIAGNLNDFCIYNGGELFTLVFKLILWRVWSNGSYFSKWMLSLRGTNEYCGQLREWCSFSRFDWLAQQWKVISHPFGTTPVKVQLNKQNESKRRREGTWITSNCVKMYHTKRAQKRAMNFATYSRSFALICGLADCVRTFVFAFILKSNKKNASHRYDNSMHWSMLRKKTHFCLNHFSFYSK